MTRPLLILALAYGLGCALSDVGAAAARLLMALTAVVLVLALWAPVDRAATALAAAALALGAAGAAIEGAADDRTPLSRWVGRASLDEGTVRLRGVAVMPVPADGERHPLVLDVEALGSRDLLAPLTGRARLEIGGRKNRKNKNAKTQQSSNGHYKMRMGVGPQRQTNGNLPHHAPDPHSRQPEIF